MLANRDPGSLTAPIDLSIAACEYGTTTAIELSGEWDLAGASAVRHAFSMVLDGDPEYVVLDLSRLGFIDSSGLHATIEFTQRMAARNTRHVIIPGPREVQRVFEIAGVADRLPFIETPPGDTRVARPHGAESDATESHPFSRLLIGAGHLPKKAGAAPHRTPSAPTLHGHHRPFTNRPRKRSPGSQP